MGQAVNDYIIQPIKGKLAEITTAGKDLVTGLWQGISNSWEWLTTKIKRGGGNILAP